MKEGLIIKLSQKLVRKSPLFLLIIIFIVAVNMYLLEDLHSSLIFLPNREISVTPVQYGIEHEEVYINTEDGEKLHGYFFPSRSEYALLYLHGNGDNVSCFSLCNMIQERIPVNALIADYRGYGKCTGKPSRKGVVKDALAMYKFLVEKGFKPENISVYGRSVGAGIATELSIREKIKSVVLESAFTSLSDISREVYPAIPDFIVKNDLFNNAKNVKKINVPILIVHGANDETVNVTHAHKLYEEANNPKDLIIYEGAMHNNVSEYFDDEYYYKLKILTQ